MVDEPMIFDRALTGDEIEEIYRAKSNGICKPEKALPTHDG
jgi:hypothetical protein